jgi:hypothetical protein
LIRDEWIKTRTYDTLWVAIWQIYRVSFRTLLK